MSDIPTLAEELDRKALNALAMVQADKENFRNSEETAAYVMRVLHTAFAGIVDDEFIDIMNQMDAQPYLNPNQVLYKKDEDYVLLDIELPEGRTSIKKNGQVIKALEYDDQMVMRKHLVTITNQLKDKGYVKYVKQGS